MNSTLEPIEGNKVKLSVTIDETEFDRDIDLAFRKIAREVKLPGFRAGKAPRRVLEARIGLAPAREQALRDAIPTYLRQAVREHNVDLIATPEVEITAGADTGAVGFDATCQVRPEVELPGYAALQVELASPEPTDDEFDEAIAAELKRSGQLSTVDRAAATGDHLVLDISAARDGEAVSGLNTEDWSYELGQGWVSDDFDDQLEGASAGDELTFTTTPKGTTEAADFTVKVSQVQELVAPELTDDWVADNTGEFETVEAWQTAVRVKLGEQKLEGVRRELVGRTTDALVALGEIEPPESMVSAEMQRRVEAAARQLAGQGIDIEQFLGATGRDPAEFVETFRPQAEQAVKVDLALRAVAAAENIEVADDDLDAEFQRIAMQVGQKVAQVRKVYDDNDLIPDLQAEIRKNKALHWLLHHVALVDDAGTALDNDLILGHTLDDHSDHGHDDHDHDDDEAAEANEADSDDESDTESVPTS